MLIAIQTTTPSTALGSGTSQATAAKVAPITNDTAGPATATRNSAPGPGNSPRIRATPPSSHSVMPSISMPCRFATSAWPSSCSSRPAKNSSASAAAITR